MKGFKDKNISAEVETFTEENILSNQIPYNKKVKSDQKYQPTLEKRLKLAQYYYRGPSNENKDCYFHAHSNLYSEMIIKAGEAYHHNE